MLHHVSLGVADLERSSAFYGATLSCIGYVPVWADRTAVGYGRPGGGDQLAIKLAGPEARAPGPGSHLAFAAPSRAAVVAFHEAALQHGGRDNGAPGLRPHYGPHYYAAFVIDPDGHRIEAVIDGPEARALDGASIVSMRAAAAPMDVALDVAMRPAAADDLAHLQRIREAAFAPVFASFRAMLGDELYERVQAREDEAQRALLASLVALDSGWEVHVVEVAGAVVGFVALQLDHTRQVGEIGLNAVHPAHAGRGVGTAMYRFALARMKEAGMRAATVSTGADPSHAPARRAYEKAGFSARIPSVWFCRVL